MLAKDNNSGLKTQKNAMSTEIMNQIISILSSTYHGNVALIYQDCRLVQIERNEKIRPVDLNGGNNLHHASKENCDFTTIKTRIIEALAKLEYGQVVIVIKEGKIIQIDRTEKQRFAALVGTYGDGI